MDMQQAAHTTAQIARAEAEIAGIEAEITDLNELVAYLKTWPPEAKLSDLPEPLRSALMAYMET